MIELDKLDKKLLFLLDTNAAMSYSELGRNAKIAPELTRYRYLRLEREGIIESAVADIDYFLLGYETYQVLVKLQSLEEDEIRALAKDISEMDSVAWIARFEGEYHLDIVLRVRNSLELAEFLDTLDKRSQDSLSKRSLLLNLGQRHAARDYLSAKKKPTEPRQARVEFNKATIDKVDAAICRVLQRDARISLRDLAQELVETTQGEIDLTPEALAQRRAKLEKSGIIRAYLLVLNQASLGLLMFRVLVSFHKLSPQSRQQFFEDVQRHPNCVFGTRTLGLWDAEFDFEVEDTSQLRAALSEVFSQRRKHLREYTILEQVERFRFGSELLMK